MDQCVTPVNVTGITHLAETGACKNIGSLFAGRVQTLAKQGSADALASGSAMTVFKTRTAKNVD